MHKELSICLLILNFNERELLINEKISTLLKKAFNDRTYIYDEHFLNAIVIRNFQAMADLNPLNWSIYDISQFQLPTSPEDFCLKRDKFYKL